MDGDAVDGEASGPPARTAAILRTIGAALGTMSAGILVVAASVIAVVAVLWIGIWLVVRTFTTVGS